MSLARLGPLLALCVGACATVPNGPSVMVLPGTGKSFERFRADDGSCRQYARSSVGGESAGGVAAGSVARSAALGTALGAVAGVAVDGRHGAAVGAGTGALVGGVAGVEAGDRSAYATQRNYDHAYTQCMYAAGHQVPIYGRLISAPAVGYPPPPPPPPPR